MQLEAHPAAELFPLLTGADYESFKADISARGLIEPIWLCEGKILDGRNRYRACTELDIEVRTRDYTGDSPVAFVWSLNGTRRQLSKSQLAMIAVKMLKPLQEEAKRRMQATGKFAPRDSSGHFAPAVPELGQPAHNKGRAVAQAAKLVGVGTTSVHQAKILAERSPELMRQVESGKLTVDRAHKIMKGMPVSEKPLLRQQPRNQRATDINRLAREGHRSEQIASELGIGVQQVRKIAREESIALPDAAIGKAHKIIARRVIEQTVTGLSGYALGLQTINGALNSISADDAREWAASITESLRPINLLRKQLLEIANG